jgi:hypothetical protein
MGVGQAFDALVAAVVLARALASAEGRHFLGQAVTAADEDADR